MTMTDELALSSALQLIGFAAKRGAFSHLPIEGLQRIEAIEQHLADMAQRKPEAKKPCPDCNKKKKG